MSATFAREVRVTRHLERPLPMRLQTVLPPQHRHEIVRDRDPFAAAEITSHLIARPVRQPSLGRRRNLRQRQNTRPNLAQHRTRTPRRRSTVQAGKTTLLEPVNPLVNSRFRRASHHSNISHTVPLSPPQDHLRPSRHRSVIADTHNRLQLRTLLNGEFHENSLAETAPKVKDIQLRDTSNRVAQAAAALLTCGSEP